MRVLFQISKRCKALLPVATSLAFFLGMEYVDAAARCHGELNISYTIRPTFAKTPLFSNCGWPPNGLVSGLIGYQALSRAFELTEVRKTACLGLGRVSSLPVFIKETPVALNFAPVVAAYGSLGRPATFSWPGPFPSTHRALAFCLHSNSPVACRAAPPPSSLSSSWPGDQGT